MTRFDILKCLFGKKWQQVGQTAATQIWSMAPLKEYRDGTFTVWTDTLVKHRTHSTDYSYITTIFAHLYEKP